MAEIQRNTKSLEALSNSDDHELKEVSALILGLDDKCYSLLQEILDNNIEFETMEELEEILKAREEDIEKPPVKPERPCGCGNGPYPGDPIIEPDDPLTDLGFSDLLTITDKLVTESKFVPKTESNVRLLTNLKVLAKDFDCFQYKSDELVEASKLTTSFGKLVQDIPLTPIVGGSNEWIEMADGVEVNIRTNRLIRYNKDNNQVFDIRYFIFTSNYKEYFYTEDSVVKVALPYSMKPSKVKQVNGTETGNCGKAKFRF